MQAKIKICPVEDKYLKITLEQFELIKAAASVLSGAIGITIQIEKFHVK